MGLIIAIVGGALFAAAGARKPVMGQLPAAVAGQTKAARLKQRLFFYQAFSLTLFFSLLSLCLMLAVHFNVAMSEAKPAR
jgi:hypothetical protein